MVGVGEWVGKELLTKVYSIFPGNCRDSDFWKHLDFFFFAVCSYRLVGGDLDFASKFHAPKLTFFLHEGPRFRFHTCKKRRRPRPS